MAWYKNGTVAVTSGSTLVTGTGTLWALNASAGDAFFGPDLKMYEIASLDVTTPNTKIYLVTAYAGSTASGQAYGILPFSYGDLTTAGLALKVSNLLNDWNNRETEFTAWQGGSATGGYNASGEAASGATAGYYPLTDALGTVYYVACPAKMYNTLATWGGPGADVTFSTGPLTSSASDAATDSILEVGRITRSTSGTAAVGLGAAFNFVVERSDGNLDFAGRIYAKWSNATAGVTRGDVGLSTCLDGVFTDRLNISGNDGAVTIPGTVSTGPLYIIGKKYFNDIAGDKIQLNGLAANAYKISKVDALAGSDSMFRFDSGLTVGGEFGFYIEDALKVHIKPAGFEVTGNILTATHNTHDLGTTAARFKDIWVQSGVFNGSDATLKTPVRPLTAAEILAAQDLAKEIGIYQWLDRVTAKGADQARLHIGLTVQRAIEIMLSHGLDWARYGFIGYDQWADTIVEHPAIEAVAARPAEPAEYESRPVAEIAIVDGVETEILRRQLVCIKEAVPAIEAADAVEAWSEITQKAGEAYSFRYNELEMFIAAGSEARLAALES